MKGEFLKNKKGISPVIATVLLISMVVVIALIVFLWFRTMSQEAITKFGGTNIELVCNDVAFDADYTAGTLSIVNTGNVPIYEFKIKKITGGSREQETLVGFSNLSPGGAFLQSYSFVGTERIILIPVLLGSSDDGEKSFICDESQHGYEIFIL